MARRRQARELVFAVLFQLEHGQDAPFEVLAEVAGSRGVGEEAAAYARRLLTGILERQNAVDERIAAALQHWSLDRLSAMDRCVLRLAVGELLSAEATSAVVIINEAVELAQRYGTVESGGFVNGVLDRIARELRPGEMRGARTPDHSPGEPS